MENMIEYTNSEIASAINEHIHSERDRAILKRRLIDGICFEPLSEEFQLSVRQVKSIVYRGQEKVFSKMLKKLSTNCG
jgi:DNA-directed RNA polymerase specialized sigma24 family protein